MKNWRIGNNELRYVTELLNSGFPGRQSRGFIGELEKNFAEKLEKKFPEICVEIIPQNSPVKRV